MVRLLSALPRVFSVTALVVLAALAAEPAEAHQCVNVNLRQVPASAAAGEVFSVAGGVHNCGEAVRGFLITWTLVGQDGDRVILRRAVAHVEPGETASGSVRLMIPDNTRPGAYRLVMSGKAPSGFVDRDAKRIRIVAAE